jgi:hypothetical protein
MKKPAKASATITIRLTPEEHTLLRRLCQLKGISQTRYLASLAAEQARLELTAYAVHTYQEGRASLSELATQTGLAVPTIMDAVAKAAGADKPAVDAFLSAAKSLAETHADRGFYELAVRAVGAA